MHGQGFTGYATFHACDDPTLWNIRQQVGSCEGWVYILSGHSQTALKAFDPIATKWYNMPPVPPALSPREGFACVAVNKKLMLIGGFCYSLEVLNQGEITGDVIVYDTISSKWSKAASMITPRKWFSAAAVDGHVYVAGGWGKSAALDSAEMYNPEENKWHSIKAMNVKRSSCLGVNLKGKFWVISGGMPPKTSAEIYDPETNSWTLIPEMWLDSQEVPKQSIVHQGDLVVIYIDKLALYNVDQNTWELLGTTTWGHRRSRDEFAFESIGSFLYIIGEKRYIIGEKSYDDGITVEMCRINLKDRPDFLHWHCDFSHVKHDLRYILASTTSYA